MGYVFISYSSKNQDTALAIRDLFKRNKIPCWMAPYDIPTGSKYAASITEALKECSCIVLILTKDSQESEHVDREVERGIHYRKSIITLQLEDIELNSSFEYYLSNQQILPIKTIDENSPDIKKLLDCIAALTGVKKDVKSENYTSSLNDKISEFDEFIKSKPVEKTKEASHKTDLATPQELIELIHELIEKYDLVDTDVFTPKSMSFEKKLNRAKKTYANYPNDETPIFLYDDTVWGSAKDGFIFTDKTFYTRPYLEKPFSTPISNICSISLEPLEYEEKRNGIYVNTSSKKLALKKTEFKFDTFYNFFCDLFELATKNVPNSQFNR